MVFFFDYGDVLQVVHTRLVAGYARNCVYEEQMSNLNPNIVA